MLNEEMMLTALKSHVAQQAQMTADSARKARRETLARDLLLKLVEADPANREYNVRAAVEYTDALIAELEKQPCA